MPNSLRRASRRTTCILAGAVLVGAVAFGAAPTAQAEVKQIKCAINAIDISPDNHVQLKCGPPGDGGIEFFMLPPAHPAANRVLSVASMAVLLVKEVFMHYENDPAPTSAFCPTSINNNNCRLIRRLFLVTR